ncbi:MAG: hypothetical protein KGK02_05370 [Rhodospirillales bacterium]|nr:hypothetical protein [Rhodospirillales bacterium]
MSYFTKLASVAVLAACLAPFAAQARSGDLGTTTHPTQHLIRVSQAQAQHGRAAESKNVPSNFETAPGGIQLANASTDVGLRVKLKA